MEWMNYALSIIAGLAATIPLVIKLVEYVQKAVREKNWGILLDMVMSYMEAAEGMFDNGADKKAWVLGMVETSAATINYDIDMAVVSKMIDELCQMTKVVNPPTDKAGEPEV